MTTKKTAKKPAKALPPKPEKFKHSQKIIFENAGFADKYIKEYRDRLPKDDWWFRNGAGYWYTEQGKQTLERAIPVCLDVDSTMVEVVRPGRNNKGLICQTQEKPFRMIVVTVLDASKFRSGRLIPVRNMTRDTAFLNCKNPTTLQK